MKVFELINRSFEFISSLYHWFIQRKLAVAIFIAVMLILPAYAFFLLVIKPLGSAGQLYHQSDHQVVLSDSMHKITEPSEEVQLKVTTAEELELTKAFLKNRVEAAKASDSVCLSIDLKDSIIYLDINGVLIRECPLDHIQYSRFLDLASHEEKLRWVSEPFMLEDHISTIPKIPYIIKAAPKDTLEAQEQSAQPLPVDTTTVYFALYFQRNLSVEIIQSEPPNRADNQLIRKYRKAQNKFSRKSISKAVLSGKAPEPEIRITLHVSQEDARAIYRGIPLHAMLSLRL
jgi:hypothetical protein